MSSTSYFFDYLDFFKAEYHFSNRTSSAAGKMMTLGYLVVFLYLSLQAVITVLNYTDKFFSKTTTFDNLLVKDGINTLNHLHMIAYVQIISRSGLPMDHNFRKNIFLEYFASQVSNLKSNKYSYNKKDLIDYLCNDKSQTLIFCINFNINSINDFIFITINKAQAKNPRQFKEFFDKYSLRIHIDHYYLRACETKFYFDLDNWNEHMTNLFPAMLKFHLFDYIVNSKGYYAEALTNINYDTGLSNVELNYKLDALEIDTDPMVSSPKKINTLRVLTEKIIKSPNLFSFNIKMVQTKDNYSFVWLKLPQAFANVMGIMEACKFCFIVFNLLFNFLLQNLAMFDYFYTRKINFIKEDLAEDPSQLITVIPFQGNNSVELTNKIELSEKGLNLSDNKTKKEKESSKEKIDNASCKFLS